MDIILASRNKKKIEELKSIILACGFSGKDASVNIHTPDEFPQCEEVEEDGATFEANAIKKAAYIFKCSGMTAVADDSGLEVDVLDGAPGVYSARYAGDVTSDWANLEKLLKEMEGIPDERRGARFVCCIALADRSGIKTFMGRVEGRIGTVPRGQKGFGYDPVFYPEGHDRTFGEMGDEEKGSMSHRGRALRELQGYLIKQGLIV
jgi:XTP/dITP diphosphohydrolase